MELEEISGKQKLLTIEVASQSKHVHQARDKFNRLPTTKEKGIIKRWATEEGLTISSVLR